MSLKTRLKIRKVEMTQVEFGVKVKDDVNSPEHYKLNHDGIECIDAIHATMEPSAFCEYVRGTVLKYIWRCNYKGDKLKDLRKAQWYLTKLIREVEKIENSNETTLTLFDNIDETN